MRRVTGYVVLAIALATGGCVWGAQREEQVVFEDEMTEVVELRPVPVPPDAMPPPPGVAPRMEVPPFALDSDLGSIEVDAYTVCWAGPNSSMCADGFPEPDRNLLAVRERLIVAFEPADTFTAAVSTSIDDDRTALDVTAVDGGWELNVFPLEPGDYVLWLDWTGAQGDAHAALTLRVMLPG